MDSKKEAICTALRRWINQRPGLEFGNYGDHSSYNAELRSIGRDKRDALTLLDAVEARDSITADKLIEAAKRAFSGRLTIFYAERGATFKKIRELEQESPNNQCANCGRFRSAHKVESVRRVSGSDVPTVAERCPHVGASIDYTTGQYWPSEYRKAAAAVCAAALWDYQRDSMPGPTAYRVESYGKWEGNQFTHERSAALATKEEAEKALAEKGGQKYGSVNELYGDKRLRAGDWMRSHFRSWFGRAIQSRWFK